MIMNRIIPIFVWCLIFEVSSLLENPPIEAILLVETSPSLLFRLENPKFVQDHGKLISNVMFLCPVEDPVQSDHARDSSWTASPLFVKEIASGEKIKDKTIPICFHEFKPGVMMHTEQNSDNHYEIGYEIDLKRNHSNPFHPSQKFDKLKTMRGTFFKPEEAVKEHVWISVLSIRMNKICKYAQQISYEITNGQYTIEDITNGDLLFTQINWLNIFNWGEMLKKTNDQQMKRVEGYRNGENLILQKLAPLEDFNSYGKQLVAYHNLNNSAMWSSIASNSWKKVQNYVRRIAKEFGRLQITTGILGEQQLLPDSNNSWLRKSPQILSLVDDKDIIPVPSIFWKLVQFEYKWQRYGEDVQFAILIITYNNPFTDISPLDENCSIYFCEINNWHIGNDSIYNGRTHCCPINENILKLLNIKNFPQFYNHFDINFIRMLINGEDKIAGKITRDKNQQEFAHTPMDNVNEVAEQNEIMV